MPLDDGDPLPGDPGGVSRLAGLLAADAAQLRGVIDGLHQVDTREIWSGENADRFIAAKDKAVPDLELVAKRMEDASRALNRFVPGMANSQTLARTALCRARDAGERLVRANAALDEDDRQRKAAEAAAAAASGPAGFRNTPEVTLGPSWTGLRDEAAEDLDAARRLFAAACKDYRDAASSCAHDLGRAIDDHLRDHHGHGLLGGLGHAVSTGVHAVAQGVSVGASWAADHFPTLDAISEGLGVAAALASLTGCEPLALALSGAKTAIDLGHAFATGKDWHKVRDDATGFALFGAGRILTGVARAKTGLEAADNVGRAAREVATSKKALEAADEAERAARLAEKLRSDQAALNRYQRLTKAYNEDAASLYNVANRTARGPESPFLRQSLRMFKDLELKTPAMKDLAINRVAHFTGSAEKGIDLYGHVAESRELYKGVREASASHGVPLPTEKEIAKRVVDVTRAD